MAIRRLGRTPANPGDRKTNRPSSTKTQKEPSKTGRAAKETDGPQPTRPSSNKIRKDPSKPGQGSNPTQKDPRIHLEGPQQTRANDQKNYEIESCPGLLGSSRVFAFT